MIIIILLVLMLASGILNSLKVVSSVFYMLNELERLKNFSIKIKKSSLPEFFIIIPVLRESRIIEKTLEHFSKIDYFLEKLHIVIVTTEREFELNNDLNKNTIEIVKNKIVELNKKLNKKVFTCIHYPYNYGVKSDQINYALKDLSTKFPKKLNSKTYIGIYDADSFINKNTLKLLAKDAFINNYPEVYQQPSLYFKNYLFYNSEFAKAFSFIQSAYTFYYESYNFIKQSKFLSKENNCFLRKKMLYLIGHGLFINWYTLKKIAFFPTPIEDTRLGHILSYLNKDVKILPSFDIVETEQKILSRIKQISVWFIGESFLKKDLIIAKKINKVPLRFALWLMIYKLYRNAVWILRGSTLFIILILMLLNGNFLISFLILFIYLYLPIITLWFLLDKIGILAPIPLRDIKKNFSVFTILFIPLEFFIISCGAFLGAIKMIFFLNRDEKFLFPKTER